MSISFKKSSNKTNISHNNRTMNERENAKNPHIDFSKSNENVYLVGEKIEDLYEKEFGEALEKYNAKQKRSDRKIDNYYKHILKSKKHAPQHELILQIGDRDDFSNKENKNLANEVLKEWYEDFEKRNPNIKIYNAVIHNDEASPHMHLNFVPVADGYKRGLEKQVSFDRALLQQDKTLTNERPFEQWREKEVLLLEKKLLERGIERKLVGTNEYKDVNEYKEKKDLEKEIQLLEKNIIGKKKELINLNEMIPSKNVDIKVRKEIKTEVKQKLFGDAEVIKKETGNYVLTPKQLKELAGYVNAAIAVKKDYERLQTTDLVQTNKALIVAKDSFRDSLFDVKESYGELLKENQLIKNENRELKEYISDLKHEIGFVYQSVKGFIKERAEGLKAFKNDFKDLVDKVKGKTIGGEFERLYKREQARDRAKGFER